MTRDVAVVGFAQDPDADRLAVIDETGRYIGEELTLALAVRRRLGQVKGPVVMNLSTSRVSEVLARTLGRGAGAEETYRPWCWNQNGKKMQVLFRDHLLSDLIGFVYSGMGAHEAAGDFLHRIRENCRDILASGRDAPVTGCCAMSNRLYFAFPRVSAVL